MSHYWVLIIFAIFVLAGCGTRHVWQDSKKIVPSTYHFAEEKHIEREIGKLRRLIVIPAEIRLTGPGPVLETLDSEISPNEFLEKFAETSANFLSHNKGYELSKLPDSAMEYFNDAGSEGKGRPIETLLKWAVESTDGAEPPNTVVTIVNTVGELSNVDGIMLLHGWGKTTSDEAFLTVLATASLAWPILFMDTKVSLSADLYEVSSGRIVWRSRATSNNADNLYDLRFLVEDLLEPIEDALPSVLVPQISP